jgi:hypothetical protein
MEAYKKAIEDIASKQKFISIIDIGCARCAFINEFLVKYFDRTSIKSLGIDPLQHYDGCIFGSFNAAQVYNTYIKGCVDNILPGTIQKKKFYINSIDQASSLLKINTKIFSPDINNKNTFYYPQDIIDRLNVITGEIAVDVYNLNDIINKLYGPNEIIDFIKIDAEGKDVDIAKSIKNNLHRIKYIGVECSSHNNETLTVFENGSTLKDAIEYFTQNYFEIYDHTDYSLDSTNLTQMSDIVFINTKLK